MSYFTCPNCEHILSVTDQGATPEPGREFGSAISFSNVPISGPARIAFDAVGELVGKYATEGNLTPTTAEIKRRYHAEYVADGHARPLHARTMAFALREHGCYDWRSGSTRGWHIPKPGSTEPAWKQEFPEGYQSLTDARRKTEVEPSEAEIVPSEAAWEAVAKNIPSLANTVARRKELGL